MNLQRITMSVLAAAALVAVPIVSFRFLVPPYFWTGCGYLLLAIVLLFFVKTTRSKVVLINLAAVLLTMSVFEWHLYSGRQYKEGRIENVYDGSYTIDHPDLGYTLSANLIRPEATKYLDNELIYKVSYSTNQHGLRRAMAGDPDEGRSGCVLVYGGSFAYGEGLNNDETLPWQIDVQTGHRHRVYNFGLHGYGPHQMLASLESGHTASIVNCKGEPVVIIYEAISDHYRRLLGLTSWDKHGPRYLLDENGSAVHAGHFDETFSRGRLFHFLDESYIFRAVLGSNRPRKDTDYDLFLAVIKKARASSDKLFNLKDFIIIYWDDGPEDKTTDLLNSHNLQAFRVADILPGSRSPDSRYRLAGDPHPSRAANEELAAFIVRRGFVP